jgi:hypothetical protein
VTRSVSTFLPMKDAQVASPLWVWNASSMGQCLNLSAAYIKEARAVAPFPKKYGSTSVLLPALVL